MIRLDNIEKKKNRKPRKRIGRGHGSGHVKTAGRGQTGQNSRSGGRRHPRYEGGQTPLVRRIPALKGFKSLNPKVFAAVNLSRLADFAADSEIDPAALAAAGIIRKAGERVKLLAGGEVKVPLNLKVHAVSKSAREKVEAAGGSVTVIE